MLEVQPSMTLIAHQRYVTAFDVSPTGEHLLSGDVDGNLYLFDLTSAAILHHHEFQSASRTKNVSSIAYRPDGMIAAVATRGLVRNLESTQLWEHNRYERIEFWNTYNWIKLGEISVGTTGDIKWSPDGRYLAVPAGMGLVIYDGANYNRVGGISRWTDNLSHIAFSPSGKRLAGAAGATDGSIVIADVPSWEEIAASGTEDAIDIVGADDYFGLHFLSDDIILRMSYEGVVSWDIPRVQASRILENRWPDSFMRPMTFSSDGQFIAHCTYDQREERPPWNKAKEGDVFTRMSRYFGITIHIVDLLGGNEKFALKGHQDNVTYVKFGHANTRFYSADMDGMIYVWTLGVYTSS